MTTGRLSSALPTAKHTDLVGHDTLPSGGRFAMVAMVHTCPPSEVVTAPADPPALTPAAAQWVGSEHEMASSVPIPAGSTSGTQLRPPSVDAATAPEPNAEVPTTKQSGAVTQVTAATYEM